MISNYLDDRADSMENEGIKPTYHVWGTVLAPSDRTGKGNVRVQVKTMKNGEDTFDDVPVLTDYGGESYGSFFLPEEGDIVCLAFMGGDFRHPAVTGCRFPNNSEFVRESSKEKNLIKEWKIKNGSRIAFSGDKGEEKIEIAGPEKLAWRLDEKEEKITLGDKEEKNQLLLSKKEGVTKIVSEKSIRLECGKSSIELKKDGTVELQCEQLTFEAKTIRLKGRSKVEVEGQELSMSGTTNVSLTGKGQVKVDSKGQLKLSGVMIQLN